MSCPIWAQSISSWNGRLDGGGTISLRTDAQGKTHAGLLLLMPIEVHENER